jgi:hypothetical protein
MKNQHIASFVSDPEYKGKSVIAKADAFVSQSTVRAISLRIFEVE